MGAKHFGARVARLEDPTLLTGRGRFVDDIRLAGALHACFVRSPQAHAAIRSIDASAAWVLVRGRLSGMGELGSAWVTGTVVSAAMIGVGVWGVWYAGRRAPSPVLKF